METLKRIVSSAGVLLLLAGPAGAVTVKNTSGREISIGIDYGAKSVVDKVPAGKSVTFKCKDGCGVTGPWGFSWMAKGSDSFSTNGKSMITAKG